jgi:hypothetical protein
LSLLPGDLGVDALKQAAVAGIDNDPPLLRVFVLKLVP